MSPMQRCFSDLVCQPLVTSYVIDAYLCLAMLHAWTLEYQHMMLCVGWWIGTKAESQWRSWRRPPGRPRNVWLNKIQEDANAYFYLRRGDLRSSGATERRNGSLGLRYDDDGDDDEE